MVEALFPHRAVHALGAAQGFFPAVLGLGHLCPLDPFGLEELYHLSLT